MKQGHVEVAQDENGAVIRLNSNQSAFVLTDVADDHMEIDLFLRNAAPDDQLTTSGIFMTTVLYLYDLMHTNPNKFQRILNAAVKQMSAMNKDLHEGEYKI